MFTKFNRVLLASGLVLTSLVGFSSAAFAADGVVSETIDPIGSVDSTGFTTGTNAAKLGLVGIPAGRDLGFVTIKTNNAGGFTLKAKSTNGTETSAQLSGTVTSQKITYTVEFGPTGGSLASKELDSEDTTWLDMTLEQANTAGCTVAAGCNYSTKLFIAASDVAGKAADTYTDTIVFTYTNK